MMRRLSDVGRMNENELREFILNRCKVETNSVKLTKMSKQELLDFIVENGFPTLYRFHSECKAEDAMFVSENLHRGEESCLQNFANG